MLRNSKLIRLLICLSDLLIGFTISAPRARQDEEFAVLHIGLNSISFIHMCATYTVVCARLSVSADERKKRESIEISG